MSKKFPAHEGKRVTLGYSTSQRDIETPVTYSAPGYPLDGVEEYGVGAESINISHSPMGRETRLSTPQQTHDGIKQTGSDYDWDSVGFRFRSRHDGV